VNLSSSHRRKANRKSLRKKRRRRALHSDIRVVSPPYDNDNNVCMKRLFTLCPV